MRNASRGAVADNIPARGPPATSLNTWHLAVASWYECYPVDPHVVLRVGLERIIKLGMSCPCLIQVGGG